MKRWKLLPLLIIALMLAACGNNNEDEPRPTELRVTNGDSTVQAMQQTIDAQQTQLVLVSSNQQAAQATSEPDAAPTETPASLYFGIVRTEIAALLSVPNDDGEVLKTLPNGTELAITEITDANVISVRFYQTEFEGVVGWVASTQVDLAQSGAGATDIPPLPSSTPEGASPVPATNTPETVASSTIHPVVASPQPQASATITPTTIPVGFPTPELYSVTVAEQIYENGRMIWFEPNDQIWALMGEEGEVDPTSGVWRCVMDEFEEGDVERLDELDPPSGTTTESEVSGAIPMQPVRGFGKVWRENEDIRERIGWALIPEQLHTTRYEYHAGGEMVDGAYETGPGEYHVDSLFQYTLILYEDETAKAPCEERTGTWEIR